MKKIQIKTAIKGALEGTKGYDDIATTNTSPYVPELLENNHDQNKLSPEYASLFASRVPSLKCLSVAHIQGQRHGTQGRMYDTRIYYDIDADTIRECDFKIGEIINSLPKMEKYRENKIGQLDNSLQLKEIKGFDKIKARNLAEQIMHAIANSKYLLIRIDDNFDWKENWVLENEVAKTLFAAIDMLPKELRPLASFALSIDENYYDKFLYDKLIIIYHGNKYDIGFGDKIKIEWNDLSLKSGNDYLELSEIYRDRALKLMNNTHATDFFDSDLELDKILKNLQPGTHVDEKDCLRNRDIDAIKVYEKKLLELLVAISEKVRVLFSDLEHQIKQITLEACEELVDGPKSTLSIFIKISDYVKKRNIGVFLVMSALIISFGGGYITGLLINHPASTPPLAEAPSAPASSQPALTLKDDVKVTYGPAGGEESTTINTECLPSISKIMFKTLNSFEINGKPIPCKTKIIDGPVTLTDFYEEIKAEKNKNSE